MYNILRFSYLVIPFAMIAGPFFVNLISILGVFNFIYLTFKNNLFFYWKQKIFLLFFLFFILFLISSLLSTDPLFSTKSSISFLRYIVFFLSLQFLIEADKKFLKYFLIILISSLMIVSISVVIDYLYYFIINKNEFLRIRFSGIFFDEEVSGFYLIHLFPILLSLLAQKHQLYHYKYKTHLIYLLFGIIGVAIVISGQRTALFYLLLLIFFSTFFIGKVNLKKSFLFITITISVLFFILNNDTFKQRYFEQTYNELHIADGKAKIFTTKHNAFYKTSIKMFIDNPYFGIGPNMYRKHNQDSKYIDEDKENQSTHPHNLYLQLLAETGVLGFLSLISLFISLIFLVSKNFILVNFYNKKYFDNTKMYILFSLIISIWPFAPSMNFFGSFNFIFLILPLSFFISNTIKDK